MNRPLIIFYPMALAFHAAVLFYLKPPAPRPPKMIERTYVDIALTAPPAPEPPKAQSQPPVPQPKAETPPQSKQAAATESSPKPAEITAPAPKLEPPPPQIVKPAVVLQPRPLEKYVQSPSQSMRGASRRFILTRRSAAISKAA